MSNHLLHQVSLYLRQHAENPVNWYPYGKEAFAMAQKENKPIFLSIGYSACHWCHVMAHESFEDTTTAKILNEYFVSIKVDREEHPEVDGFYQQAYQCMTHQGGGWPLSLFLTSQGKPFYGGTYFPNVRRYGLPAFREVLMAVVETYAKRPLSLLEYADTVVDSVASLSGNVMQLFSVEKDPPLANAASSVYQQMDMEAGGLLGAPKFPNVPILSFLLQASYYENEPKYAESVLYALQRMAQGGIYDHVGGGFSRYSTDAEWHIPHFEKMLYDNALLLRLYAEGYQVAVAGKQAERANLFAQRVQHTVDWLVREMRDPSGAFYASQDADSEGIEGKYYVWSQQEVQALCTAEEAQAFCGWYGITAEGNWVSPEDQDPRGVNVLYEVGLPSKPQEIHLISSARAKLFAARARRVPPKTDTKILPSWNGLLLTGLSFAARVFQNKHYQILADELAQFFIRRGIGSLVRNYQEGATPLPATLEDYAFLAEGLFYHASVSNSLISLEKSRFLADCIVEKFYNPKEQRFMLVDPKEQQLPFDVPVWQDRDGAISSAASVACKQLLHMAELVEGEWRNFYREPAEKALRLAVKYIQNPLAFAGFCSALYTQRQGLTVLVLIDPASIHSLKRDEFSTRLGALYHPSLFVFRSPVNQVLGSFQGVLGGKPALQEETTAYICQNQHCSLPITDPSDLRKKLLLR